jgi:predicted nucleic acid-binding protein
VSAVIIDTNVLVFDTFEDSEFHSEASKGLDYIEKWHLSDIVFHEFMWFFKSKGYALSRARLKMEEYLMHEKSVFSQCTSDDVRFAAKVGNYSDYNDFVILSVARRLGFPLFTFDDILKKKASRHGVETFKNPAR